MAAGAADTPGNGWQSRSVMIVRGQGDTRIKNGEDYDTLTLASLFALAPGNRPKRNGLAFIPSSYHATMDASTRLSGSMVALSRSREMSTGGTIRWKGSSHWFDSSPMGLPT